MNAMQPDRQSMYDTFGDKRALFLKALEVYVPESVRAINVELRAPGSPLAAIWSALVHFSERKDVSSTDGCMGINAICEFGMRDGEVTRIARRASGHWRTDRVYSQTEAPWNPTPGPVSILASSRDHPSQASPLIPDGTSFTPVTSAVTRYGDTSPRRFSIHIRGSKREKVSPGNGEYLAVGKKTQFDSGEYIDDVSAAGLPVACLTAHMALSLAGFRAGKTVLSPVIGGSVGNAITQLARALGARHAISTTTSQAKAEHARTLGFDEVIDLSTDNLCLRGAYRVRGRTLKLQITFAGLGLYPGLALPTLLTRKVGHSRASLLT